MRLFYALCPDDACRKALWEAGMCLGGQVRGKFTRRENLHLTLVFLGETDRVGASRGCLARLRGEPFLLTFTGLGRFERRGGDILFAGVEAGKPLYTLQSALEEELLAAGFYFDRRPYRPHLTLARQARLPREMGKEVLKAYLAPCTMRVEEACLMKSERVEGQLHYIPIAFQKLG